MHVLFDAATELLIYFTGVVVIMSGLIIVAVSAIRRVIKLFRNTLK